jgi:hypothetical protein
LRRSTHVPKSSTISLLKPLSAGTTGHGRASGPRGELAKMDEQQGLRSAVIRLEAIVGHLLSAIDASKVMSRQVLMWEYGDVRTAKEHSAQAKPLANGS